MPGLRWNIFSGGKIRNNIRVQEARTQQLLFTYEQVVLFALDEVESTMVAYEREKERRDRLAEAVDASERTVELVRTQYMSGLTDFLNLLDAQRTLATQQDSWADSEGPGGAEPDRPEPGPRGRLGSTGSGQRSQRRMPRRSTPPSIVQGVSHEIEFPTGNSRVA